MKKPSSKSYKPSEIEAKWQAVWEKEGIYSPNLDTAKKPFYNLMMFPYPSAEGMHVGNMYAFTGADVYGRFQRMQGKDVFEPIGLDGFGIHSENYAIKVGNHPAEQAKISEKNYYKQLKSIGNSFDWSRTVETYKPNYYKWTQWLFVQLFKAGLAYRKKAPVNFCPSCKTVLADEQVLDGVCERCETEVVKKDLEQWFFRITKYADRLLSNIDKLDWSEKVKIAQKQWIGRSEGTIIKFSIFNFQFSIKEIEVFTTRADTLYGATFLVLAPEHPIVISLLKGKFEAARPGLARLRSYIEEAKKKTEREREEEKEKTGVFTGLYAINPVNKDKIPVWVADYAIMGYGTGAIMAVPAHDQRDFEFAEKYNLPVIQVIKKENITPRSYLMGAKNISDQQLESLGIKILGKTRKGDRKLEIPAEKLVDYINLIREGMSNGFWNEIVGKEILFIFKGKNGKIKEVVLNKKTSPEIEKLAAEYNNEPYLGEASTWKWLAENDTYTDLIIHDKPGTIINSEDWDGIKVPQGLGKIIEWLEKKGIGKKEANYHLRDWLISRQRYWGPPIPMIYCGPPAGGCGWKPVPEEDLPVKLPFIEDYKPLGTGKAPLASHPEFYKTKCPNCGMDAKRETDVSDTFLDSSWYFLRYIATEFDDIPFPTEKKMLKPASPRGEQVQHDIGGRKRWLQVNMYIGGAEHSVLHLLYSRFITMVLKDLGFISFEEPFTRFYANGLLVKDGAKMSKSKGNVVIPDQYIKKFGADTLRTYLMFMGPFSQGGDFRDTGIEGMHRFLRRLWTLAQKSISNFQFPISNESQQMMHKTIKKVTEDIEGLNYNTAIAALMEWYNFLSDQKSISQEEIEIFSKLIAPFAPHMTEELFFTIKTDLKTDPRGSVINQQKSIHVQQWPKYDSKFLIETEVTIVVQINGKLRDALKVQSSKIKSQKDIEQLAKKSDKVKKYLDGVKISKVIYVEGKVINFVAI